MFAGAGPIGVSAKSGNATRAGVSPLTDRMTQHRSILRSYSQFALPLVAGLLVSAGDLRSAKAAGAPITVACIGEQTTHGDLFPSANNQPVGMQEYPAMLQTLLGSGYDVHNLGNCCASVVQGYTPSETHPYVSTAEYTESLSMAPDIVIIGSWGRHDWGESSKSAAAVFTIAKFQSDYDLLVSAYIALANKPKIFCGLPIPILAGSDGPDNGYKTSPAVAAIQAVCTKYNLPTIDFFHAFLGHPELFRQAPMSDDEGEHVNNAGFEEEAALVYEAITGMSPDGGLLAALDSGLVSDDDGATGTAASDASVGGSSSGGQGVTASQGSGGGLAAGSGSGSGASTGTGSGGGSAGTGSSSGGIVASAAPDAGEPSSNAVAASGDTSAPSGGSGGGCSTAPGSGPTRWNAAVFTVFALALLARRRNRRRSPHAPG